mgnify:CR=1 FL=1
MWASVSKLSSIFLTITAIKKGRTMVVIENRITFPQFVYDLEIPDIRIIRDSMASMNAKPTSAKNRIMILILSNND